MDSGKPRRQAVVLWALIVFALAIGLRLPSCYESFWLDELHTAWAIWGDLGDVADRAEIGNQTPLYFQLMWFWKSLIGSSEVALRLSSVLAVSTAAALLVVALKSTMNSLIAGVLAGSMLAVESNALFFGTELRPYAWIILLTVTALWTAIALIRSESDIHPANLRLVYISSVCLACLLQPTALVTLGVLTVFTLGAVFRSKREQTHRLRFHITDLASLVLMVATLLALLNSSLGDSWESREQWRLFAKANSARQLWLIWPWLAMVLVPFSLGVIGSRKKGWGEMAIALLPWAVAMIATLIFFIASIYDFVFLWHRRYFIAALPMLAWSGGAWLTLGVSSGAPGKYRGLAILSAGFVLGLLVWQQGTANRILAGNTRLATRGEDWRGATRWLNGHRQRDQPVLLDSGLIEARLLDQLPTHSMLGEVLVIEEYLEFPVSGPYLVSDVYVDSPNSFDSTPVGVRVEWVRQRQQLRWSEKTWIISRSSKSRIQRWCDRLGHGQNTDPEFRRFGRIWVVGLEIPQPIDTFPPLTLSRDDS